MTKTKAQLRAEAVERLKQLDEFGGGSFEYAILGSDKMAWSYMDKRDALIDLLTDDDSTIPEADSTAESSSDELPEGDAVAILREAASYDGDYSGSVGALRRLTDSTTVRCALETLADIVERDYVRRDAVDGDSEKLVCDGLREQRDHWLNIVVDVYKRFYPHGEYGVPDDPTDMINDAIDAIELERDEWKAKAETCDDGVKRSMTNLDWLMENNFEALQNQMCGQPCSCCLVGCEEDLGSDEECDAALREWLLSPHVDEGDESCRQDADQRERAESADCESDSRDKLRGIIDDLKVPTDPGEAAMMSVNKFIEKQTEHESRDTREKLEDEIRSMRKRSSVDFFHSDVWVEAPIGVVLKWLDRQEAITKRELIENARSDCDICGNDFRRQRDEMQDEREELQREVDRLTRENVNLAHDLGECMAEHETLALVDMDDNETANDVCPDVLEQPSDDQPEDGEAPDCDAAKGDTHDFDDTREKVEEDMRKILHDAYMLAWEHGRENRRGSSFERVLVDVEFYKLLDRQEAITEHTAGIAAKEASKVLRETIVDLREEVAERDDAIAVLKAENEELRKALGK